MASQLQQFVPAAQLLGLSGASFLSAYIASFSWIGIPAVELAPTADLQAKQWSRIYNIGKNSAPPAAISCSAVFAFLAWQARHIPAALLPVSPTALYSAAAVLAPCIAPYTFVVMMSGVNRLEAKAAGKPDAPSESETKALVRVWSRQNMHRSLMAGTAALLGAVAVLASR